MWKSGKGGKPAPSAMGLAGPEAGGNKELFSFAKSNGKPSLSSTQSTKHTLAFLPASPSHQPGSHRGEGGVGPRGLAVNPAGPRAQRRVFLGSDTQLVSGCGGNGLHLENTQRILSLSSRHVALSFFTFLAQGHSPWDICATCQMSTKQHCCPRQDTF